MTDRAASIRARLLAAAKERGQDFNLVLDRYAVERFLYRLSISDDRGRFWLKGALLFNLWFDEPLRPTRDADFLGIGSPDPDALAATFRAICRIEADDGIRFDPRSVRVSEIREGSHYHGLRVKLIASLAKARCSVQIDIGFGDAVTPGPEEVRLPGLLSGMPEPRLYAYPRATVVAEKVEAIVDLGMANSRMKDYFDLRALAQEQIVDSTEVARAIVATFKRRRTPIPDGVPVGLSDEFANDTSKQQQWAGFLKKNRLDAPALVEVVREVRHFVDGPLRVARDLKRKD